MDDVNLDFETPPKYRFGAASPKRRPAWMDFLRYDPREVGDDTLVAVLLAGATSRNAGDIARELLVQSGGDLVRLTHPQAYSSVTGVGEAGRARMIAAAELYRRAANRAGMAAVTPIVTPADAVERFKALGLLEEENLSVIYLNSRHVAISTRILTRGSTSFTIVDPKQVLRPAIELDATAFVMAHNHPSGDPTPSPQDVDVTKRMAEAGHVLGITLFDHIVIAAGGLYTSLAEKGMMPQLPGVGSSQVVR